VLRVNRILCNILATALEFGTVDTGANAGEVIQVVSTTKTSVFTASSSSFVDVTGLSVSITPSSASNKILVIASIACTADGDYSHARLMRDSTAICIGDLSQASQTRGSFGIPYNTNGVVFQLYGQNFLDLPSTTSSTTYKIQVMSGSGGTQTINRSTNDTNNSSHGSSASTITVMEIKG
jgi:hypothetical protein